MRYIQKTFSHQSGGARHGPSTQPVIALFTPLKVVPRQARELFLNNLSARRAPDA